MNGSVFLTINSFERSRPLLLIQSELIRDRRPLDRYVGADCAGSFRRMKAACDPTGLLNAFMAPV